ncbi:Uncharacterised protein r2_g3241 [Pycnogonum litorale]
MNTDYNKEVHRLKSFDVGWIYGYGVDVHSLAKYGFYNDGGNAVCFFCKGTLNRVEERTNPLIEHIFKFPRYPLMTFKDIKNEPKSSFEKTPIMDVYRTLYGREPMRPSYKTWMITTECNMMFSITREFPMQHPEMKLSTARMSTFGNVNFPITNEALVEAGFFLIDMDKVKCYYCGIILESWADADDAWVEHVRWSSSCLYVLLMKVKTFIRTCLEESRSIEVTYEEAEPRCTICMCNKAIILTLPCCHLSTCPPCAVTQPTCCICRHKISGFVRTYSQ